MRKKIFSTVAITTAGILAVTGMLAAAGGGEKTKVHADELESTVSAESEEGENETVGNTSVVEDENVIVCDMWLTNFSQDFEIDEKGIELTFNSKTNQDIDSSGGMLWNTPSYIVHYSDDDYRRHQEGDFRFIGRSDVFGYISFLDGAEEPDDFAWINNYDGELFTSRGYTYEITGAPEDDAGWAEWLEANKNGVTCTFKAVKSGDKVIAEFTNNGVTSKATIPVDASKKVLVTMSGENCTMSGIPRKIIEQKEDELVCDLWFESFSAPYKIDEEGIDITFNSKTFEMISTESGYYWDTPSYAVYYGDANLNMWEYLFIGRSDVYGWTTYPNEERYYFDEATGTTTYEYINTHDGEQLTNIGYSYEITGAPVDEQGWAEWLEANKNGVECRLKAVRNNDKVIVELTNNGVTSKVTIPTDVSRDVYVVLTGEKCKLSGIKLKSDEENNRDNQIICDLWFDNFSNPYKVDEKGIELTFKSKTSDEIDAESSLYWDTPQYIVHYADDYYMRYQEGDFRFIGRSDAFGWMSVLDGAEEPDGFVWINNYDGELFTNQGYTYETAGVPEDEEGWTEWLAANKKGVECTLKAVKIGDKVIAELTNNGITSRAVIPVDASKEVYVTLTGEKCIMSDIAVKAGWENYNEDKTVIDKIEASAKGDIVETKTEKNEALKAEVLEAARKNGVTLVIETAGGMRWTIKSDDISVENLKDIDLTVERVENVIPKDSIDKINFEGDKIELSLAHSGDFGFKASLTVNVDVKNKGKYANLFYYNPITKLLEFMQSSKVGDNGDVMLDYTHASDYVIILSDVEYKEKESDESVKAPDEESGGSDEKTTAADNSGSTDKAAATEAENGKDNNMGKVPETGDSTDIMFYFLVISFAAGIILLQIRKDAAK